MDHFPNKFPIFMHPKQWFPNSGDHMYVLKTLCVPGAGTVQFAGSSEMCLPAPIHSQYTVFSYFV